LRRVEGFGVFSVILEEVCETVVHEGGPRDVIVDLELYGAGFGRFVVGGGGDRVGEGPFRALVAVGVVKSNFNDLQVT
jgi:hypothetical protein